MEKPYNNLTTTNGGLNSTRMQSIRDQINNGNQSMRSSLSVLPYNKQPHNKEVSKSFVDIRMKMNEPKRDLDLDSVITDLSAGDEWAEIVKYEKERFEEEQQKQREDFINKRKMIKETLDKQLKERNQRIRQEREEKKHFDKILLDNAKKQEE